MQKGETKLALDCELDSSTNNCGAFDLRAQDLDVSFCSKVLASTMCLWGSH
jgi:hypothetical protein